MRGEKDPNDVDLTPKLSDLTRNKLDGGEEPDDDRDSTDEVRARRGGPKNHRSTTQEAKATHTGAAANHKNTNDGTGRNKPVMPKMGRVRADENPSTADLPQKQ
jgi:hypothetical protein